MPTKTFLCAMAVLLLLGSCTPPKYLITTTKTRPSEQEIKSKKFIFLPDQIEDAEKLAKLINSRKGDEFLEKVKRINDSNTRRFLRSALYLFDGKYSQAFYDLVNLPKSAFDYETQVLYADALHEMHIDTLNYQRIYQRVVDSTKNENIRQIAIKRNRLLKYEK